MILRKSGLNRKPRVEKICSVGEFLRIEFVRVCLRCLPDKELGLLLKDYKERGRCSFCKKRRLTVSIQEVADFLEEGVFESYEHGQPSLGAFGGYEGDELCAVIASETGADEDVACEIAEHLFENGAYDEDYCFFDREASFVESRESRSFLHQHWLDFTSELKTGSRFFGPISSFLEHVFGKESRPPFPEGLPELVLCPGDENYLYRARIAFELSDAEKFMKRPHHELSYNPNCPPSGRMLSLIHI